MLHIDRTDLCSIYTVMPLIDRDWPNNKLLADAVDVPYDSSATPSYGKDLSVWEELVGNFGRFPANSNHAGER